jgi:hypothetical protein
MDTVCPRVRLIEPSDLFMLSHHHTSSHHWVYHFAFDAALHMGAESELHQTSCTE